jgi:hypothetical protein
MSSVVALTSRLTILQPGSRSTRKTEFQFPEVLVLLGTGGSAGTADRFTTNVGSATARTATNAAARMSAVLRRRTLVDDVRERTF